MSYFFVCFSFFFFFFFAEVTFFFAAVQYSCKLELFSYQFSSVVWEMITEGLQRLQWKWWTASPWS